MASTQPGNKFVFGRDRVFVENSSPEGELLLRGGVLQQLEFNAQTKELRFFCENGQFSITRSTFLRLEPISHDRICIHCNGFLVRITGDNAAIEIDAIGKVINKNFFAEHDGQRK